MSTTGEFNTAFGAGAIYGNTTGSSNTAIGQNAGVTDVDGNKLTTGSGNTFVGSQSGFASPTQRTNATAIGYRAKVDADNAMVLGGTGADAVNVGIGTVAPSARLHVNGGARFEVRVQIAPQGDIFMGDFTAEPAL